MRRTSRIVLVFHLFLSSMLLGVTFYVVSSVYLSSNLPMRTVLYTTEREDMELTLHNLLNKATSSIDLSLFSCSDPFLPQLLKTKIQQGIQVTIRCDAKIVSSISKLLPPEAILLPHSKRGALMHQKIVCIDQEWILLGSLNWSPSSLRIDGNSSILLHNPTLAQALSKAIRGESSSSSITSTHCQQEHTLFLLPDRKQSLKRLIQWMDEAQHSIRIAMFAWTHPQLIQAALRAHQRGVQVTVFLHRPHSIHAKKAIQPLLQAGVDLRQYSGPGTLHHKFAWIDEQRLCIGSVNWTRAGFHKNQECWISLAPLSQEQNQSLQKLWHTLNTQCHPPHDIIMMKDLPFQE